MPILAIPGLQTRGKLQLVDYYSGYTDTSSESGIHNFPASTTTVVSYPIAPITVVEAPQATRADATVIAVRNITYDGANLWVAPLSLNASGAVYKLDANYNEIANFASPRTPSGDVYGIRAMCWDGQYLWLACRNQYSVDPPVLAQVNSVDGSIVRTLPSPELCRGIEWADGFLWISNETDDLIQKLDPADGTVLASYAQPPPPPDADALGDWPMGGLAYDGTYLWYCHESPPDSPSGEIWDRIYKLDLNNNLDVLESLYGTKGNFDLAYVDGHLWTGHYRPERIVKYRPSTLPTDFLNIETLQYRAVARINAAHDDRFTLRVRIMSGATVLAAADSAGAFTTVGDVSGTAWTTFGPTAFGYVNTAATEAQWDAATVEMEQVFSQNMGGDGAFIQLDVMDFSGTYNAEVTQKIVNVGQAVEADAARPLSVTAIVGVGQAVETSSAHPAGRVTVTSVGQAVEADQAHPVTTPEPVSVALATETSSAHPVSGVKVVHVGQAVETALAHPVDRIASVDVGRAIEVAQARSVAVSKIMPVGQATETDTSHPVVSGRMVDLTAGGVAGSGVVADLRGEYQLVGKVIGNSGVVGHLPLGGLEATAEGSSGAGAELQRSAELTSAAVAEASISGELLLGVGLTATVASSSATSSGLNVHAAISGSSDGASSVSTSLALVMSLAPGAVVGEALVQADTLTRIIDLGPGPVDGTSSTSGDVLMLRGLDASVISFAHVASDVRRNLSLAGQVSSESTIQFQDFERQRDLSGLVIGFAVVLQTNIWTTEVVPVRIEVSAEFVGVALSATGAV